MLVKLRKHAFRKLEQKEYEKSKKIYTQLINSDYPEVEDFINISHIYIQLNDYDKALKNLLKAINIGLINSDIYYNIGIIYEYQSKVFKALISYKQAIFINPNNSEALTNLAILKRKKGKLIESLEYSCRAIKINSNLLEAHLAKGKTCFELNNYSEALKAFKKATTLNKKSSISWFFLASIQIELKMHSEGIVSYKRAISIDPNKINYYWNLSNVYLQVGNYKLGLKLYEYRHLLKQEFHYIKNIPLPLWNGEIRENLRLLIVSEQGLGDIFHFCRYVLYLQNLDINITLCTYPKLHNILRHSGIFNIVDNTLNYKSINQLYDSYVHIASLPFLLKITPKKPLISSAYIKSNPNKDIAWKRKIKIDRNLIIGLNWQGNISNDKNKDPYSGNCRSFPLEIFKPLSEINGIKFLSLQKGDGTDQLKNCSFNDKFIIS